MKVNDQEFKSKLEKIKVSCKDVSILLSPEHFDNGNLKGSCELKNIMFLGLNRSHPEENDLCYHNMREALDFLIKKEDLKSYIEGSYLSDFIKGEKIIDDWQKVKIKFSKEKEVSKAITDSGNKDEIVKKCCETLFEEISQFNIKIVFCWGWKSYGLIRKCLNVRPREEKPLLDKQRSFIYDNKYFIYLKHYSRAVRGPKEKNESIIIEQIKTGLRPLDK